MPKGFSLFECILVVTLLACIIYLSLSFVPLTIRFELDRLYAAALYLQQKAILTKQVQQLSFVKSPPSYTADTIHYLKNGNNFGLIKNIKGPPSKPLHYLANPISWPKDIIYFYPDGKMSSGAVYITDGRTLMAVTIDACELSHIRRWIYKEGWLQV